MECSQKLNRLHYKFTKLYYSTQIVNNSIKIKTDHSDITTYNCRIHFDAYVYSKYFIKFFILYDRSLTFKNMHSFFRDFWLWRQLFHIFSETFETPAPVMKTSFRQNINLNTNTKMLFTIWSVNLNGFYAFLNLYFTFR